MYLALRNIEDDTLVEEKKSEKLLELNPDSFIRENQKFVYSVAFRFLKNHEDAEDASQEVFIKAINNWHKFQGKSSISTWLYSITANHCKNVLRKNKLKSIFKPFSNDDERQFKSSFVLPDKHFENKEFMLKFSKVLDSLPEKQRETFALRYFDELKYEEISDILGTSVGALKANYYHATKKLAQALKKDI